MPVEPYFSTCGGYYESVYSKEEVRDIAWSYREVFTDTSSEGFYDTQLSRAIYYALCNGYSMVIDIPNDQHAISLYGATFDTETNLLTSAYVCDSSGASFSASSMSHVRVGVREDIYGDSRLTLLGYYDENNDLQKIPRECKFPGKQCPCDERFCLRDSGTFGVQAVRRIRDFDVHHSTATEKRRSREISRIR